MKGRHIIYEPEELAWIEAHKEMPRAEAYAMFCARFMRQDVSFTNYNALCKRKGWFTGRTGQFVPGQIPQNKGKPMPDHVKAKVMATTFKPGQRQGIAVKLYKPIGTERMSKDGYVERKIHDGLPLQSRWRAVHLIRWEELHGPVPAGHALKCLNGNKANTDPGNWEAVPRALLPRLAGAKKGVPFDSAPAELKPVIMATAKLEHRAREARKESRRA